MPKKLNHREKLRLARRLRRTDEIERGIPPFDCSGWSHRRNEISKRVSKKLKHKK
jgi:hypothetical protein